MRFAPGDIHERGQRIAALRHSRRPLRPTMSEPLVKVPSPSAAGGGAVCGGSVNYDMSRTVYPRENI